MCSRHHTTPNLLLLLLPSLSLSFSLSLLLLLYLSLSLCLPDSASPTPHPPPTWQPLNRFTGPGRVLAAAKSWLAHSVLSGSVWIHTNFIDMAFRVLVMRTYAHSAPTVEVCIKVIVPQVFLFCKFYSITFPHFVFDGGEEHYLTPCFKISH